MKKLLLLLAVSFFLNTKAQIITTAAGNGTLGNNGDGGQATAAGLYEPNGVIFDAVGNMYFTDYGNNNIRKVTTAGIISTIAGGVSNGYSGDGGQATAAKLNGPSGLAFDALGNLYFADLYNHCVRMINTAGIITTVAGNGTASFSGDGGQATSASLYSPTWVAFDGASNLYIADEQNNRIRMVDASGIITTVAGSGTLGFSGDNGQATSANLHYPYCITFDVAGNLYFSDLYNSRIRKVNSSGIITTIAGENINGFTTDGVQATAAGLYYPNGIIFDASGNLFIADTYNQRVRKINTSGIISTIAGVGSANYYGDGALASNAWLNGPIGIAFDNANNLYIADSQNRRIRKITPSLTMTVNSSTICTGSTTTLTATGATNYTWSPSTGLSSTTGASVVANPTVTTVYTVLGSVGDSMNLAKSTVTVFSAVPTISLTNNINTYTICGVGSQPLGASGANAYIWSWTPSATLINATTAYPTASTTTATVYTVTGANICGASSPLTVTVNISITPTLSLLGNTYTLCNGSSQTLSVSGASTYTWSPALTLANYNSANPIANPTTTTVYTVTGTNTGVCNSSPATVTVNVVPVPTLTLISNNYEICNGSSQTFSVSGVNTYTWIPSTTLSNANSANPIASPTTTTIYTVSGIAIGCLPSTSKTVTVTVLNAAPTLSLSSNSYTICNGVSQSLNVSGASSYTWVPSSNLFNSNTANPIANPTTTTVYTVTGSNVCGIQTNMVNIYVNSCNTPTTCIGYDFSNGKFNGWIGKYSLDTTGGGASGLPNYSDIYGLLNRTGIDSSGLDSLNYCHEIFNGGNDYLFSFLQCVAPGHSKSVKLGKTPTNSWTLGYGHQTLTKTFSVTATITNYTYWFAFVSNGLAHLANEEPFFQAKFYDANNNEITSVAYRCGASTSPTIQVYPNSGYVYQDWTQISANLSAYVGQNVTVIFETADCTQGGHFGYAYVDVDCGNSYPQITQSNNPCVPDTLTAPIGYTSYNWFGNGIIGAINTYSTTVNTAGTYSVIITDASGTSYTVGATVAQIGLKPVASFTANQVCIGTATSFTNQTTNAATSYVWNFGYNDTSSVFNPTHTYTASGTYTATLKASNLCGVDSVKQAVTVFSKPILSINSSNICIGNMAKLTVSGATTYSWSTLQTTATITPSPTITTTFSVTGVDVNNCSNTDTTTVTVYAIPSITASASSNTICAGVADTLTASGANTYTWSPSINLTSASLVNPIASPTTTTIYTVTGTDIHNCINTTSLSITINPTPNTPALIGTSNPFMLCQGNDTILNVAYTNGCYSKWYYGNVYLFNGATVGLQDTTMGASIYKVVDSSATTGCVGSPLTLTVNVYAGPSLFGYANPPNGICLGDIDTMSVTGSSYYTWLPPTGLNIATGSVVIATPTVSTTYSVTGTVAGCSSSVTGLFYIPIYPIPTVSFLLLQDAAPQTWDAYPSYSSNVASFTWDWGDGTYDNTAYPSHVYAIAGKYNICLTATDTAGCSITYCQNDSVYRLANNNNTLSNMVYVNVLHGMASNNQRIESDYQLVIYPNPNIGIFVVNISKNLHDFDCIIYDVNGKVVLSQMINGTTTIDASNLAEGVYNLSFISIDGMVNKRLVIVR